ncbi:hypothetical protein V1478_004004 [Vespula squamosa]|uniref:Uncharacterized protein n=1 Tax=Vespula squamosa TaxID=30214 RepID=A0ABD2BNE6_VESSQ
MSRANRKNTRETYRSEAHESLMTKAEVKKSQEATASRFGGVPERFLSVATRRNWTDRGKSRAFRKSHIT